MWQIKNIDEKKMKNFGYKWGQLLRRGDIICLDGDLGAGKTTLTQSIAKGMNIDDYVNSPSYTIICEYQTSMAHLPYLYHMDVYRIADEDELYEIGFDEYIDGNGVCIIEWASKIKSLLPDYTVWINIDISVDGSSRNLTIYYNVDSDERDIYRERWGDLFESFGFGYQYANGYGGTI